jgi:hypothetical protein
VGEWEWDKCGEIGVFSLEGKRKYKGGVAGALEMSRQGEYFSLRNKEFGIIFRDELDSGPHL